jgi:hypothetical protein
MANFNIDYLIVAGGGAGGRDGGRGGGGGAGGLLTSVGQTPLTFTTGTQYTLTVGQGGIGNASFINDGDDSELNGADITLITATGGGRGGGGPNTGGLNRSGSNGGSGGGAISYYSGGNPGAGNTPATTPSQGNNGGDALTVNQYGAGGGGGAGAAGSNGSGNNGGTGGIGVTNSITVASGTGPYYAGGGAGGGTGGNVAGGLGGGGSWVNNFQQSGTNGLGGGAAGGGMATSTSGGSGVIILRYTTNTIDSYTTTGITPTEDTTTVPGQTILSFTTVGTGTITFTALPPAPPPFDGTKVTTPVTDFNKPNTEEGLKLPSGTNANQPSGVQGMIRNDTEITVDSSASAITHYNGTNWQYFAATESSDYPTSLKMYLDASDTTSYPGSGTVWTDLTGNGNNAALTNMTSVNWNSGGYFTLDGSNEYFAIGSNAFQSTTPITACGWVYVSDFTSFRSIFSLRALANQSVKMIVAINTDKTIRLDSASTSNFVILGVSSVANGIPSGQWVHVAAIIDYGTKEYKLYKNKTLAITGTNSSIRNGSDFSVNTFQLGANYNNQYFSGNISKFRVYDKVLSQAEIDALVDEGR